jgi:hypothetical protein
MDEKLINILLTAFYNGKTTQEEEAALREFFNTKNIPGKWHTDKELFNALYDSLHINIPKGFPERLENNIDRYIRRKNVFRRLLTGTGSIAAAILVFIGIFFSVDNISSGSDTISDTFTNPQEAAVAAEKILVLISCNLNKGLSPLEKAKESMNKTNEILNKNLEINN